MHRGQTGPAVDGGAGGDRAGPRGDQLRDQVAAVGVTTPAGRTLALGRRRHLFCSTAVSGVRSAAIQGRNHGGGGEGPAPLDT